jgi:predicted GH43/DUF377 family glycosyl hydrolase
MLRKEVITKVIFILITVVFTSCVLDDNELYFPMENGITWTNHQDTGITYIHSSLIKDNGVYKMWTFSTNTFYYQESTDGINWGSPVAALAFSDQPYGDDDIVDPWVIKDGSLYKMWYCAASGGFSTIEIIYCESNDGTNWSNFQLVLDSSVSITGVDFPVIYSTPCVIKADGRYKMWFIGNAAWEGDFIYAESDDGINWTHFTTSLYRNSLGTYDKRGMAKPSVIRDSNNYRIWYSGIDSSYEHSIIYAESKNGITWENFVLSMNNPGEIPIVINDRGTGKIWYLNSDTGTVWYAESR